MIKFNIFLYIMLLYYIFFILIVLQEIIKLDCKKHFKIVNYLYDTCVKLYYIFIIYSIMLYFVFII